MTNPLEIWKDIEGFEGYYMVSNLGNVMSLDFDINYPDGRVQKTKKQILSQETARGYKRVTLVIKTEKKRFQVHRLVANEFIINHNNKPCVNHKNGIKTDNRVENLEWCSYSENTKHAFRTGLIKPQRAFLGRRGKDHPESKPLIQISKSGKIINEFESMLLASEKTGIAQPNISKVCNGHRQFAGGYKWKFKN